MKAIPLHIHDDDCLEARLQAALDLTHALEGHLTCVQAMPFELGVPGDLYGATAAYVLPEIRKQADALRERLGQGLAAEAVAAEANASAVAGILTREGLIGGLNVHGPGLPVAQAMLGDLQTVQMEGALAEALPQMESSVHPVVVVDRSGAFRGLLTRENLGELLLLANARSRGISKPGPHVSGHSRSERREQLAHR